MSEEFDLRDRRWIQVLGLDGELRDVSLREVFAQAHEIKTIAGEIPTQDVAILRLLLAVLYRTVDDEVREPKTVWRELWESPTLPVDVIHAYLDECGHRFDLFDSEAPFYQVAGLTASKTSGLVKLIADLPDGHSYFTTRAGAEVESLSIPEAARWLVHTQAFDPSGIKTGAIGDPRVKGGKGYPIGTGWAGRCGLVVLSGRSLKETLLLNVVLGKRQSDDLPDLPVWERPPLTAGVERRHPEPLGPADIMTWPSRRVLLHRDGDRVVDVQVSNGDPIHARNRHNVEMMTAWRYSKPQTKQHSETVFMPRLHDPSRALWRGLAGILTQRAPGGPVGNDPDPPPCATVEWFASLVADGAIPSDYPVTLQSLGLSYGTQDASIESLVSDRLDFDAVVAADDALRTLAVEAASLGEESARHVGQLAFNLALVAGRDGEGPRESAREEAYEEVERAYRGWLSSLHPQSDPMTEATLWQRELYGRVRGLGAHLIEVSGGAVRFGRESSSGGRLSGSRRLDGPRAWNWFITALAKTLPAAHSDITSVSKEQVS